MSLSERSMGSLTLPLSRGLQPQRHEKTKRVILHPSGPPPSRAMLLHFTHHSVHSTISLLNTIYCRKMLIACSNVYELGKFNHSKMDSSLTWLYIHNPFLRAHKLLIQSESQSLYSEMDFSRAGASAAAAFSSSACSTDLGLAVYFSSSFISSSVSLYLL